jgi:hypothetical protein
MMIGDCASSLASALAFYRFELFDVDIKVH